MQDLSRRNLFGLAAAVPLGRAFTSTKGASATGADAARTKARMRIQEQHLPNVPLISHEGKEVLFYNDLVRDKIVTVNFFYSKCDEICPMVMANLVKVQKLLGEQVGRQIFMYSITLKPEQDTLDVVRIYRTALGAAPGWTFFTGKTEDIDNVRYGNEPLMLWAACPGQAHTKWVAESFEWMVHPELNRIQKS